MTNFTMRWAALSLAVVGLGVAGCTTEADVNADGGSGTGGTGGSAAGTGGTGGSTAGTGGTGGSTAEAGPDVVAEAAPEAEAGLSCTPEADATNCEKCALSKCCAEANACEADKTGCYATLTMGNPLDNYYACLAAVGGDAGDAGMSADDCGMAFITDANGNNTGGNLANALLTCLATGGTDADAGDCTVECGL
jgi:hypothetical protein